MTSAVHSDDRRIGTPALEQLVPEIHVETQQWINDVPGYEAVIQKILAAIENDQVIAMKGVVSFLLTDDQHQASLNQQFRGKATSTNVLSFPAGEMIVPIGEPYALGDVSLARETLLKEANSLAIPIQNHFSHLLVHGVLHLLGYDHEDDDDAQRMEAAEVRILNILNIPNPYLQTNGEQKPA